MSTSLREQYLLDPDVVFLNHGSFGACPKPVFEAYQRWQRELEQQPLAFFRRADGLLADARATLAAYLHTDAANLVFVPNATTGINMVARSLPLRAGDEILATDHEYGALHRTWQFVCKKTGAHYVRHPIPAPVAPREEVVEAFWQGVTARTRVIFLSHVTSPTALILPVAEICRRARAAGILTVVDGAHAPGQVPIDLTALGVDFYSGNCHKWLSAPKGSAFLYVHPAYQSLIEPLVVSWGWHDEAPFVSRHQMQGTRDLSAFLSVPAAIEFQQVHDWEEVQRRCHALASQARARLTDLTGLPPLTPDSPEWFAQMISIPLSPCDLPELSRRLSEEYRIEVPLPFWNGLHLIRISFQAYNTQDDLDHLITALTTLLPKQY
jgi:isopenicillin-N epimerase